MTDAQTMYKALFTRHKLTQVRPGLKLTRVEPTSVEPGLAVFTRQKLTRVSLCRVNRALVVAPMVSTLYANLCNEIAYSKKKTCQGKLVKY